MQNLAKKNVKKTKIFLLLLINSLLKSLNLNRRKNTNINNINNF